MCNSLHKQGEIHQELGHVHDTLQVEVVLAAEQRIFTFLLESHAVHLVPEAVGVRLLQTLPVDRGEKNT